MNFLFANLKDRDFLVQRISDFLQRTPDSLWGDTNPLSLIGPAVRQPEPRLSSYFTRSVIPSKLFVNILRRPPLSPLPRWQNLTPS